MVNKVSPGDVLAGKYRVERVLGVGGMGMVVAARHLELRTLVALKFMLSNAACEPEASRRFVQEARSAARLQSEHVARVSDFGTLDSGEPYIVIEYLEGEDLGSLLRRSGPLPVPVAVELMLQACEAIEEAHASGIIHRDIKPQNLFLTTRRKGGALLKVLDFGLSKVALTGEAPASLQQTNTGALLGSPLYMSPEQMRSARDVDHRADIWSLGATLYQLLCAEVPFPADSLIELCMKLTNDSPRELRVIRPEVPLELERVVLRCLEKDPAARFASVAELSAALASFTTRATEAAAGRTPPPFTNTGASWAGGQDPRRTEARSPLSRVALVALVVTVLAAGLVWVRGGLHAPASSVAGGSERQGPLAAAPRSALFATPPTEAPAPSGPIVTPSIASAASAPSATGRIERPRSMAPPPSARPSNPPRARALTPAALPADAKEDPWSRK